MKKLLSYIFVFTVLFTVNVFALPNVYILATGGTIAGLQ